jgi:hypothetical protein
MPHGSAEPNANKQINAHFWLELDGIAVTAFDRVTIGDSEWAVLEQRTGVDGDHKLTNSGLRGPTTITFRKDLLVGGWSDISTILTWHDEGSKDRRSGAVVVTDRDGTEISRANFKDAWVSKRSAIDFDSLNENEPVPFEFELSVSHVVWS